MVKQAFCIFGALFGMVFLPIIFDSYASLLIFIPVLAILWARKGLNKNNEELFYFILAVVISGLLAMATGGR